MISGQGQTGSRNSRPLENRWRSAVIPAVVLVCLAAWWAALLPQTEESIFARVPVLDELYYLNGAAGENDTSQGYFMSPLYPKLIAWTGGGAALLPATGWDNPAPTPEYITSIPAVRGIRLLQIACWLGIVLLLHLISRHLWADELVALPGSPLWLWVPSLLFVLYRPASVFAVSILLELPLTFLLVLFLYLLLRGQDRFWQLALAGLVLGVAALLRGTVLALLPLAFWAVWHSGANRVQRATRTCILAVCVLLPLLPASVHNSRAAGRLAGPTFNGGFNLYIGNSPQANGFYVDPLPGDHRTDPAGQVFLAQSLGVDHLSLSQTDAIWLEQALSSIKDRPDRALALWLKKIWLHLQAWEIDQLTPQAGWVREAHLLKVLVLPFGLLAVLGLLGIWPALSHGKGARLLALSLFLLVASQSLFFVVSRYRLALVPIFALLAMPGILALVKAVRKKERRGLVAFAVSLVLAAVLVVPWSLAPVKAHWLPRAEANEARRWLVLGQAGNSTSALEKAEELYRAATVAAAEDPTNWLGLAVTLKSLERLPETEEVLGQAILQTRDNLSLRLMLVSQLLSDGRRSDALVQGQSLLRAFPENAETLHNVTVLLAGFGNTRAALDMARRFVTAHPSDPRAAIDLGVLLARSGDIQAARQAFLAGLKASPGHDKLMMNLELLNSTSDPQKK